MNRPRILLALLSAAAIGELAWYVPKMPPLMATHYDGAGNPDGWMTRGAAAALHLAILGVTALAFPSCWDGWRRHGSTFRTVSTGWRRSARRRP